MVGKKNGDGRRTLKFCSQVTVDLDNPPVWRFHAFFDEYDLDIALSSWTNEMIEMVIDELHFIFPEWQTREKTFRRVGKQHIDYISPLTEEEMLHMGVPLVGPGGAHKADYMTDAELPEEIKTQKEIEKAALDRQKEILLND